MYSILLGSANSGVMYNAVSPPRDASEKFTISIIPFE